MDNTNEEVPTSPVISDSLKPDEARRILPLRTTRVVPPDRFTYSMS